MGVRSAMKPGIYFDLSEADYLAAPALSSSGIKNLLIDPLEFWRESGMNPDFAPTTTDAKDTGSAFHRRLLEGAGEFYRTYAALPEREDFPGAIDGHDALKAECERLGLKKSGRIVDLCERILEADPSASLFPVINDQWQKEHRNHVWMKKGDMARVERVAAWIEANHPKAMTALTGGMSEVSIFWSDEETGVPMKSRLDRLNRAIIDLKTFSNSRRKPIDAAVAEAVAYVGYGIQAVLYTHGIHQIKQLLRAGDADIHGDHDPKWLNKVLGIEEHSFWFLFVEQGTDWPHVRLKEFTRKNKGGRAVNLHFQTAWTNYRMGVDRYLECCSRFGDSPWCISAEPEQFNETDFPLAMFG